MEKPPIRGSQKRYVKVGAKGDAPKGSSIQAFTVAPARLEYSGAWRVRPRPVAGHLGTWAGRATAGQGGLGGPSLRSAGRSNSPDRWTSSTARGLRGMSRSLLSLDRSWPAALLLPPTPAFRLRLIASSFCRYFTLSIAQRITNNFTRCRTSASHIATSQRNLLLFRIRPSSNLPRLSAQHALLHHRSRSSCLRFRRPRRGPAKVRYCHFPQRGGQRCHRPRHERDQEGRRCHYPRVQLDQVSEPLPASTSAALPAPAMALPKARAEACSDRSDRFLTFHLKGLCSQGATEGHRIHVGVDHQRVPRYH